MEKAKEKSINGWLEKHMHTPLYGNILIHYKSFRDNNVLDIINQSIIEYEIHTHHPMRMDSHMLSIVKWKAQINQ